ncbi:hypothetical protein LLG95_11595 [bacterium]|nr:hypothetical protein [bacterium]
MGAKCNACGVTTELEKVFRKQNGKSYCPPCWLKRQQKTRTVGIVLFLLLGICLFMGTRLAPEETKNWRHLNFFILLCFFVVSAIPHEFGHALVARMVGWRPRKIQINYGKTFFKGRILGIPAELNGPPIGGITLVTPFPPRFYRIRMFIVVACGPLANLALAIAAAPAFYVGRGTFLFSISEGDHRLIPLKMFFLANVIQFVINMVPFRVTIPLGKLWSDGGQLLQALFMKKELINQKIAESYMHETLDCFLQGDFETAASWIERGLGICPSNLNLRLAGPMLWTEQWQLREAREEYIKLLQEAMDKPPARAIIENNIAYVDALMETPELLAEADEFSSRAMANLGWVPAVQGTRGMVLSWLGKIDEAATLLKSSMEAPGQPEANKAINCCCLAVAEMRRGNTAKSDDYMNKARNLNPKCFLIERTGILLRQMAQNRAAEEPVPLELLQSPSEKGLSKQTGVPE